MKNQKNFKSRANGKRGRDSRKDESREYISKGRRPREEHVVKSDVINDASYYVDESSTVLTDQLYTYTFDKFLGVTSDMGSIGSYPFKYTVPGLMQIAVNPSVTYTDRVNPGSDGINVNGLKTFTILASESGRVNNYQPSDVNLAILAIGNVIANFSFGARALGLVGTYNQRNRLFPESAMTMCGFDISDLKSNLANYRANYNYLVQKFNKIPIFKNIKYLEKCSNMFSGVYLDMSNSSLAQAYAFVPDTFWILDETSNPNGTILKTVDPVGYTYNNGVKFWPFFSNFLSMLESQIDALLGSTTLNLVYADILRVGMKQGYEMLKLDEIPSNYAILPSVVDELSDWLNNAIILGRPADSSLTSFLPSAYTWTAENDVESDPNTGLITYNPAFALTTDWGNFEPVLNFKHEAPDLASRIYATRLFNLVTNTTAITPPSPAPTYYIPEKAALTDWYITQIAITNGIFDASNTHDYKSNILATTSFGTLGNMANDLTKFDWGPLLYMVNTGNNRTYIIGDLQWFTSLPFDKIKAMDDVAMLNLMKLR